MLPIVPTGRVVTENNQNIRYFDMFCMFLLVKYPFMALRTTCEYVAIMKI